MATAHDSSPLLRARGVVKTFGGITSLAGVDIDIPAGQVMCLAGENGCGKSTLVKIVSGVYQPDAGEVYVGGERLDPLTPRAAIDAGIQVIYQDLALFPHLSVSENIALPRLMQSGRLRADRGQQAAVAQEQLARINVQLPLDVPVGTLSVANQQIVAICRALSLEAKVLFMDEPTTALTTKEVDRLLGIVLDLRRRGLSVVFISHKLDEVFKIADTITILRDGVKVGDFPASELDEVSLSEHMTGRRVTYARYLRSREETAPVLETRGLSRAGHYRDVSLVARPGDIVGLTGLLGSGRTELALSLFGLNPPDSGQVLVGGEEVRVTSASDARRLGIALLPEDRKSQGLFLRQSVKNNITSTVLPGLRDRFGSIDAGAETTTAERIVTELGVNNKDVETEVGKLSGGNQQKVAIGKWIVTRPRLFILDSPTVGIDIGSKEEIYQYIHRLAEDGLAVLLISDEPEEISVNCNRVYVMHDGSIVTTFEEEDMRAADFKAHLARIIANPRTDEDDAVAIAGAEGGARRA